MNPAKAKVRTLVTNLRHDGWEFVSKRFPPTMTKGAEISLRSGKRQRIMSGVSQNQSLSPAWMLPSLPG